MRNRIRRKREQELLHLLDSLPETSEVLGTFWMHEQAIAITLYGNGSVSARRYARKMLKRLQKMGMVESRKWEMGVSWRLSGKP